MVQRHQFGDAVLFPSGASKSLIDQSRPQQVRQLDSCWNLRDLDQRNNETEPDYLNLPLNELLSPSTKVTASRMRIRIAATCG